jgi:hypothetical protein
MIASRHNSKVLTWTGVSTFAHHKDTILTLQEVLQMPTMIITHNQKWHIPTELLAEVLHGLNMKVFIS